MLIRISTQMATTSRPAALTLPSTMIPTVSGTDVLYLYFVYVYVTVLYAGTGSIAVLPLGSAGRFSSFPQISGHQGNQEAV